jgi:hypothetical protein
VCDILTDWLGFNIGIIPRIAMYSDGLITGSSDKPFPGRRAAPFSAAFFGEKMSFARFGPDSDVYVYYHVGGFYDCCGCRFMPSQFLTKAEIIAHLQIHIGQGDKVPDDTIEQINECEFSE